MDQAKMRLLEALQSIEGAGDFVHSGTLPVVFPGLHVQGMGEVELPFGAAQAKKMIAVAHKAPFGKGSKTIVDPNVRSAWEIDAALLTFKNPGWAKTMEQIAASVATAFGLQPETVGTSLYKLLLYEKGDFFLPHKDSEKEPGMFGTLIVGLPARHEGGELLVRFDGQEHNIDFSTAYGQYVLPYAAFYADCEHEIKPLRSGLRLCLVYNLVQRNTRYGSISAPQRSGIISQLTDRLKDMAAAFQSGPQVFLLEHQYTPTNFDPSSLKRHDRLRAEMLMAAAEQAGYCAALGLLTHYQTGELVGGGYEDEYFGRRRGHYREPEPAAMGELYEEERLIRHWAGDVPGLGILLIAETDILTLRQLDGDTPLEQEEEGYTGNAGMTMSYWYHYGAVVVWSKAQHAALVAKSAPEVSLAWVKYYLPTPQQPSKVVATADLRALLEAMAATHPDTGNRHTTYAGQWHNLSGPLDYQPLAQALIHLNDPALLTGLSNRLADAFTDLPVDSWIALLEHFGPDPLTPLMAQVMQQQKPAVAKQVLELLHHPALSGTRPLQEFRQAIVYQLPEYIAMLRLDTPDDSARRLDPTIQHNITLEVLTLSVRLSNLLDTDEPWLQRLLAALAYDLPRNYVNTLLASIATNQDLIRDCVLAQAIRLVCIDDLIFRTLTKPSPPADWSRPVPQSQYYGQIWETLRSFLTSPTQQSFDYRQNKAMRSQMIYAIKEANADLTYTLIAQGSPQTLRVTKTQASYETALQHWEQDSALLKELVKG